MGDIVNSVDKNNTVLHSLSKAFDIVDHNILLNKLLSVGFGNSSSSCCC